VEQSPCSARVHIGNNGTDLSASSTVVQPYETVEVGIANTPSAGSSHQTPQQASHDDNNNELTLIENTLYGTSEMQPVQQDNYEDPADVSSLYPRVVRSNDLTLIDNDLYDRS